MLFSATISKRALDTARSLMKNLLIVLIEDAGEANPKITHMYFTAEQRDKIEVLRKLAAAIRPESAIVFLNKSEEIQLTTAKLQYHHISAYDISGSASKEERKKALESFRKGEIRFLIASDIAARGLDIKGVTHIFNLDLPEDPKGYLHRVGRTGRMGEAGTAISIVTEREKALIRKYQRELNISISAKKIYKGTIMDLKKEARA